MTDVKTCSIVENGVKCDSKGELRGGLCQKHYARSRPRHQAEAHLLIECQICGRKLHHLGSHLPRVHEMTSHEYRSQFPGAPLASDHIRGIRTDQKRDLDGEAYWTPQRIIRAMQRWAERTGSAPSSKDWERRRRGRVLLNPAGLRAPRRDRPSSPTVVRVFGSWSAGADVCSLADAVIPGSAEPHASTAACVTDPRRARRRCAVGSCFHPINLTKADAWMSLRYVKSSLATIAATPRAS
jgi:hypothetical protein